MKAKVKRQKAKFGAFWDRRDSGTLGTVGTVGQFGKSFICSTYV